MGRIGGLGSPLLLVLFVALGFACRGPEVQEVRGVLVGVQSTQLVHAEAITLRDGGGVTWTFTVSPEVADNGEHPTTASHLRQHMAGADPVIVRYRETPEGIMAVRILDGAGP